MFALPRIITRSPILISTFSIPKVAWFDFVVQNFAADLNPEKSPKASRALRLGETFSKPPAAARMVYALRPMGASGARSRSRASADQFESRWLNCPIHFRLTDITGVYKLCGQDRVGSLFHSFPLVMPGLAKEPLPKGSAYPSKKPQF